MLANNTWFSEAPPSIVLCVVFKSSSCRESRLDSDSYRIGHRARTPSVEFYTKALRQTKARLEQERERQKQKQLDEDDAILARVLQREDTTPVETSTPEEETDPLEAEFLEVFNNLEADM